MLVAQAGMLPACLSTAESRALENAKDL